MEENKWKEYLDESYYLDEVDRCEITNYDVIEECVRECSFTPMDEWLFDDLLDMECQNVDIIMGDIRNRMSEDGLIDVYFENIQEINDEIYSRNESRPLNDIVRNTGDVVFYYSTGVYVPEGWCLGDDERSAVKLSIANSLRLDISRKEVDDFIEELWSNAVYGGMLRIYFSCGISEIMDSKIKTLVLDGDVTIGIIDSVNGSGNTEDFMFDNVKIPFNRKNIFCSKAEKWGWEEISGERGAWASGIEFSEEDTGDAVMESADNDIRETERMYRKTFEEGGCTYGDVDMNRHRNIKYINEYPCRWECPHCGMQWLD